MAQVVLCFCGRGGNALHRGRLGQVAVRPHGYGATPPYISDSPDQLLPTVCCHWW